MGRRERYLSVLKAVAMAAVFICAALVTMQVVSSCSVQRTKIRTIQDQHVGATIQLPKEREVEFRDISVPEQKRDTLQIVDFEGRQTIIMKAVRDSATGDMVAHDVLDAAVVTARFRNVAERHGKVDIEFQVIVPESLQDSKWQLRFRPEMYILKDTAYLDPVNITGRDYRKAQLRGYQRYENFINSIITDTTRFINLGQLEIFLQRNIPDLYRLKRDSTRISDEVFASIYGVSEQEAVEHYTNEWARKYNNWKIRNRDRMYARYVKAPIITEGLRLDTIIQAPNGTFIYNYIQTIETRPKLKKVDVVLRGEIFDQGEKIYNIPATDPLSFYISSLSAFVDGTEHYLTKVIERRAEANTSCRIDFEVGRDAIKRDLGRNAEELDALQYNVRSLMENTVFDLDSITVIATSSPDGSWSLNEKLSQRRAESMSKYLQKYIAQVKDSLVREDGISVNLDETYKVKERRKFKIPFRSGSVAEDWDKLDSLVRWSDTLTQPQKDLYFSRAKIDNKDSREVAMRQDGYYKYVKDNFYPVLRSVNIQFNLHRKGMVKDTVHTTVLDTTYMNGVQAIRDRDYIAAIALLGSYNDYNTAVAYLAMDRNASAMAILRDLERTAQVNYMLAVLYSRQGDDQNAVQCYLHACAQEPSYVHRGNLDPEIAALIKRYGLNKQPDDDFSF